MRSAIGTYFPIQFYAAHKTLIIRMGAADVETKFVSVERVAEYLRLEEESWDGEARAMLGTAWPSQGEVRLEAVTMRYRLHRSLVLKGVDLFIPGKAKLSFCGRTGCGKSSLFSVLNRLYPLASGRVLIDWSGHQPAVSSVSANEHPSGVARGIPPIWLLETESDHGLE